MAERKRGNCKNCRYFSSRDSSPGDVTIARCNQGELSRFELSVSGASGCNAFEARISVPEVHEPATPVH